MNAVKTVDGILQIRMNSAEEKPTDVVYLSPNSKSAGRKCAVREGSELIETDTGKTFIFDAVLGWNERNIWRGGQY